MPDPMVQIEGLTKVFDGKVRAVDGLSLELAPGEIFGMLGPNGAGKSTTIKILVTLLRPDAGVARVAGHDVVTDPDGARAALGYVPQEVALDRLMSGRQNLELLASLYHLPPADIPRRVDELLGLVELTDRADDQVKGYSGGMKKRLDIAGGLLHRPKLLVLDEPTLGLDIQTRVRVWETIRKMRGEGTTILVTTHYMEEADQLCDRIGIIDHGKIQAIGTPDSLKSALGGDCVELAVRGGPDSAGLAASVAQVPGVSAAEARPGDEGLARIVVWLAGASALAGLVTELAGRGMTVERLTYARPTLDEVFLKHTGRKLRD
jgi:ABC-2 type transport system ATP-binding protein